MKSPQETIYSRREPLPLVSVIVPTRNSAKTIGFCLASISNQTHSNVELIIVDNNSIDDTKAISRKYTDKVFNLGPERNAQRILGMEKSSGEYLVFIDSDMELSSNLIEEALKKCTKEGCDAVILPEISVGEGFWAACRKLEKICVLNTGYHELANRFIKREVYTVVGGYDVNRDWIGGEDYDIHERIRNAGYHIGRIEPFIKHHEIVPFRKMFSKYVVYGKYLFKHVKRHPRTGVKQFIIAYPMYLKNWKLFIKDPLHGIGLVIMKLSQYVASTIGMVSSWFEKR